MAVAEIERILFYLFYNWVWCSLEIFIGIRKNSFTRNQQWKNSAMDDIFDVLLLSVMVRILVT